MDGFMKVEDVGPPYRAWIVKNVDVLQTLKGLQVMDNPLLINEATPNEARMFIYSGSLYVMALP